MSTIKVPFYVGGRAAGYILTEGFSELSTVNLSRSFQLFKIIEELRGCVHKSFTGDCIRACLQDPQLWGDMIDVLKEQMSEGAWEEVRDVVGIKAFQMIEKY